MGFASDSTSPTMSWNYDNGTSATARVAWYRVRETEFDRRMRVATESLRRHPHALPRGAQLEEAARLADVGRVVRSSAERERHGFQDAPRRPGYRAPRLK